MHDHIRHQDIAIERKHDGSLELSAMHPDGYMVTQRYYGYTRKEARQIFHRYANS